MIEVVREYHIEEVKQIEVRLAHGDVQAAAGAVQHRNRSGAGPCP